MSTLVTMEATRIGICDDMPEVARKLESIVSAHLDSIGYLYKTEKYYNGMDALSSADALDILFLDIEMPDMDGIETGRKVQERNPECRIIMATARTDRFKEAFKIRAFRFITKPFDKDEIQAALDETLQSMVGIGRIRLYMNRIPYDIPQRDICYIEACESYVEVLVNGRGMMRRDETLTRMFPSLDKALFYRPDRKYAVNLAFIESYKRGLIKVKGLEIRVSRSKKKEFEKIYEEFLYKYR